MITLYKIKHYKTFTGRLLDRVALYATAIVVSMAVSIIFQPTF